MQCVDFFVQVKASMCKRIYLGTGNMAVLIAYYIHTMLARVNRACVSDAENCYNSCYCQVIQAFKRKPCACLTSGTACL